LTSWGGVDLKREQWHERSGSNMAGRFTTWWARGSRRERIFRDEADGLLFYETLGEAGARVELMSNHYHPMVETPEATVVAGMRWLQKTYTRRHNIC
jgi:REP element-mobilizing transposase RayT